MFNTPIPTDDWNKLKEYFNKYETIGDKIQFDQDTSKQYTILKNYWSGDAKTLQSLFDLKDFHAYLNSHHANECNDPNSLWWNYNIAVQEYRVIGMAQMVGGMRLHHCNNCAMGC